MLKDDRIQLFDNGGPNDTHAEPCIETAKAGKHIICEKLLARTAKEAAAMLDAATKAGVKHARNGSCHITMNFCGGAWTRKSRAAAH
jgi:predicted dehydrogenase